ncbi:hypothetical protein [Nannocystis pusilla]|uniref:hypothetical protein n=1 Tax=Nannocystis pusilla TaxID=889268 RepID=UPI003B79321E
MRGELTFAQAVRIARYSWPQVWSRFNFEVVEVDRQETTVNRQEALKGGVSLEAGGVVARLRARHPSPEWLLLDEVQNGTGGRSTRRFDAIAFNVWPSKGMVRVGYEIKVSRSDFTRELDAHDKRQALESHCHEVYFATAKGVCEPREVPEPWGLLVEHGDGLKCAVRAKHRDVGPIQEGLAVVAMRKLFDDLATFKGAHYIFNGSELTQEQLDMVVEENMSSAYKRIEGDRVRLREQEADLRRQCALAGQWHTVWARLLVLAGEPRARSFSPWSLLPTRKSSASSESSGALPCKGCALSLKRGTALWLICCVGSRNLQAKLGLFDEVLHGVVDRHRRWVLCRGYSVRGVEVGRAACVGRHRRTTTTSEERRPEDMTEETRNIDSKLAQYALEAKQFMIEAGEGVVRDELIMRAVVAYGMLKRRGMLAKPTARDVELIMTRAHAIAIIAHNFEDYPPSTQDRERLFAHVINTSDQ